MDYAARRAGANVTGAGRAHGVVTKREEDGRYAFVEIEATFDVQLAPAPDADMLRELVAKAEAGCFVGNSLTAKPRYRWIVNGEEVS
jgi:organic hydroperoxide reductase OsmC/OhrA